MLDEWAIVILVGSRSSGSDKLLELLPRSRQTVPDRRYGLFEDVPNLLQGEAFVVVEHEDFSQVGVESLQDAVGLVTGLDSAGTDAICFAAGVEPGQGRGGKT